ncbi:ABC transporter permease [Clostridioides sp. ES-S-0049-02]|uniref:ABC transporter permease n=1 Tax=Clostridioides sp. ES-S-0049-02 TaxID=2770778 RepID=UPI001D111088
MRKIDSSKRVLVHEDFSSIDGCNSDMTNNEQVYPSMSFARETISILRHNKIAVVSFIMILILMIGSVFFPIFCNFDFSSQNVAYANNSFFSKDISSGFTHIFGTDNLGRDIFVRIWYGTRVSLLVAGVVAIIDCIVGVVYGSISGYIGGMVDNVMMRTLEIISGIPYLVVVLLLMAVLPQGIGTLIIAYTLVGWTSMARLVRGQVVSLMGREFIIAAKIMGASMGRIIFFHLIPNMLGIIIVHMTLSIPGIIFTEAFLSMLGMGVPPPYPSLGIMANEGVAVFQTYPARLVVPGLFICLIMLSFNLLGDQLQDALNPRLRRSAYYGRHSKN